MTKKSADDDVLVNADAILYAARNGEKIMERKAESGDAIGVLAGFLLAFALDNLLDLDEADFKHTLLFHVYTLALVITCTTGFSCVLLMTFISAKLRRLIGRSVFHIGEDGDAEAVDQLHPGGFQAALFGGKGGVPRKDCDLYARKWYRGKDGNSSPLGPRPTVLFYRGVVAFKIMMLSFIIVVVVKLFDVTSFLVAGLSVGIIVVGVGQTLIWLTLSGATEDLA